MSFDPGIQSKTGQIYFKDVYTPAYRNEELKRQGKDQE